MVEFVFERKIRKPIILLGFARSGTTFLGYTFNQHRDTAYLREPRTIWRTGNAYRSHDELTPEDLTPAIARRIDGQFASFLRRSAATRFVEKTPSNCLRVGFIHALYPDAKIIHIIRDGRAAVRSLLQEQRREPWRGVLRNRMRITPVWEWPAYLPQFFQTFWRTKVLKQSSLFWGPRPRGWEEWVELPPHVRAARQWKACLGAALRDGRALPAGNYREVRYEDLIRSPLRILEELVTFAELSPSPQMLDFAIRRVDPRRGEKWRSVLTPEQEREVEAELNPLLRELGY